jgi:hypothetical protein
LRWARAAEQRDNGDGEKTAGTPRGIERKENISRYPPRWKAEKMNFEQFTVFSSSEYRSIRARNEGVVTLRVVKAGVQKAFRSSLIVSTLNRPFFEQSTGPLSSEKHSVRMGMMASLRVARSGGETEFRVVLGLPVIPRAPRGEQSVRACRNLN